MSVSDCTRRYLRISLLYQLPINFMISLSTTEQRRAMTPAVRREWEDTFLASNPSFVPQKPTSVLRVFDIMVEVIFSHLPVRVMTRDSGLEGVDPWALRWSPRGTRSTLGKKRGYTESLCTTPPLPPPDAVILGCERQHDKVGGLEVACCGCGCKDSASATEDSIFEAEQGAL